MIGVFGTLVWRDVRQSYASGGTWLPVIFYLSAATLFPFAVGPDRDLLFETGGERSVDAVVVVTTTPEVQRERILARGNMTSEKLKAIQARQLPDAEKRKRADFVVDTSHGLDDVRAQIREILAAAARMPRRRS